MAAPAPAGRWRCLNCEYIHEGESSPEYCPVCGAPAERFEACADTATPVSSAAAPGHVVIAGAGIAGVSAAEAIRRASPETGITLLSKEAHLPYYRLNLTRYLAGEVDGDALPLHPEEWYEANRIFLLRGTELCGVNPAAKRLRLRNSGDIPYDRLVLAIGAHPFVPPFPGAILLGDTRLSAQAKHAIESRADCSSLLHGSPDAREVLEFLGRKP